MNWTDIITNLGFPIFVAMYLLFLYRKIVLDIKIALTTIAEVLKDHEKKLDNILVKTESTRDMTFETRVIIDKAIKNGKIG